MSNYPTGYDDDSTLPAVNDNLTEIGGEAINALRDAVVQIEQALGLNIAGTQPNLATRLGVFINPDGTPNASVITSLGLVTLPIRNDQIAENAGIPESKLRLDFRTQDLFNYVRDLSLDVNTVAGWISVSGIKLEPHLIGAIYRHTMNQIDVSNNSAEYLKNNLRVLRDNSESYSLVNDINDELLAHQWADGSPFGIINNITTNNGSVYPSNYGHTASGIFLNTSRFKTIPQTAEDLQLFAEFIDESSILLLGTRIQNLYSSGISRISRSSSLTEDGYGQAVVPLTPVIAYLKNTGSNSNPFDDIDTGDDIIEFKPSSIEQSTSTFDAKFALVKPGDIIRINYGTIEVAFLIREKKYIQDSGNKKYVVRIAGKNLFYSTTAVARIDRALANSNKYGVLSVSQVNNPFLGIPSLVVGSPRGAQALGIGFNPDKFDESHYLLYLALFPTGSPSDGYTFLPGIDVTGNAGKTPGSYTLESIVQATNESLRKPGFNFRFTAFSYQGEFGIMLADSYNNAAFSVVSAVVAPAGSYDQPSTLLYFPNNVVDVFPTGGNTVAPDPLGFGSLGGAVASPPYMPAYGSAEASQFPTKLFVPLSRNNYYVNGTERERLNLQVGQALDVFGDGYWVGTIQNITVFPGPTSGHVQVTYRIPLDLSTSDLKVGKTLVVQSLGAGSLVDFGRFIISNVAFDCAPTVFTDITVYDAVHANGVSPATTLGLGNQVAIYFNSDSVSFNAESATDFVTASPFKRHFEVYVDQNSNTFTQERGRISASGFTITVDGYTPIITTTEMSKMELIKISPKLRGYQFGPVNKITLTLNSFDNTTGLYSGYLASYDGITFTHLGPLTSGKKGEITRFYDETNVDYVEIIFDLSSVISSFVSPQSMDIQLFPTLSLDDEIMLIGTCQVNDSTKIVNRVRDERQFGNTGTKELSTAALDFIAAPDKNLHFNGVVRGFNISSVVGGIIYLDGGVALVNGKLKYLNSETFTIPKVRERYSGLDYPINWALCVNDIGELDVLPLTDYDTTIVSVPNAPDRVVSLFNAVTGNIYPTDSVKFVDLLNNRKDLTILYMVSSTVTGSGSGATVSLTNRDLRRFINDQDSNIPAIITSANNQGNFRTFNSAATWVKLNNAFQDTIYIKNASVSTYDPAFNSSSLNSAANVNIVGHAPGSTLTFTTSLNMSNVNFKNLTITFNAGVTFNNVNFDTCNVTVVSGGMSVSNSKFENCNGISITGGLTTNAVTFNKCNAITVATGNANITDSYFNFCNTITVSSGNATLTGSSGNAVEFNSCGSLLVSAGAVTATNVKFDLKTFIANSLAPVSLTCEKTTMTIGAGGISGATLTLNNSYVVISGGGFIVSDFYATNSTVYGSGGFTVSGAIVTNTTLSLPGAGAMEGVYATNCYISFDSSIVVTSVKFINCTLFFPQGATLTNVLINPSTVTIGGTIATSSVTILDSTLTVSIAKAFQISSKFRFERNTVTYSGAPVSGYNTTDLVNAGSGMIYSSVGGTSLQDVYVNENSFTTSMTDHFPYVSIQLTGYTSVIENISISRNKITNTSSTDDIRAAISIMCPVLGALPVGSYPKAPELVNVFIDGNMCANNQMILISAEHPVGVAYTSGLLATINTKISNNVCGTIGFLTANYAPSDFANTVSPNSNLVRDKKDTLMITGNTCKFIANIDSVGDYIMFTPTEFPVSVFDAVSVDTGSVTIDRNTANWIQVGCRATTFPSDGIIITNNRVSPANPSYLSNFTDASLSGLPPGNVGIMLKKGQAAVDKSRSIISGNVLAQKPLLNSGGSNVSYYYDAAIVSFNNANIIGNSAIGVVNTVTNPLSPFSAYLYLGSTPTILAADNEFNRNGLTIQAYVKGQASATNSVRITNNIFDSQYIDAANTIETVGVTIPAAWAYHSNKNQIFYREISLSDGTGMCSSVNFGSSAENLAWGYAPASQIFHIDYANNDWFAQVYRQIGPNNWSEIGSTEYITTHDFDDDYSHRKNWSIRGAIDPYLPENVRILSAKIGYMAASWTGTNVLDYGTSPAYNAASLTIFQYKDTTTSNDPVNGVLNMNANLTSHGGSFGYDLSVNDRSVAVHFISSSAIETAIRANPVYLTIDLSAKDYTTGKNYRLAFEVDQSYKKAASAETGHHYFFDWSPVVLKCIYR